MLLSFPTSPQAAVSGPPRAGHRRHPTDRAWRSVGAGAARRVLTAVAVAAAITALTASAASAHVRVHADSTESGSFAQLTFRVPTESDTASTTKVEITLPQDNPFLYVSTKPLPGWTATVTEAPLATPATVGGTTVTKAARTVTWQAQAGVGIAPGQYQDFDISAGPLPAAGTVLLPAAQSYSDGTVVTWGQPTPAGGPEPEHPAPALVVIAAAATSTPTSSTGSTAASTATTTGTPAGTSDAVAAASTTGSGSDPLARTLAAAALLIAILGLAWTVWARYRRRTGSNT